MITLCSYYVRITKIESLLFKNVTYVDVSVLVLVLGILVETTLGLLMQCSQECRNTFKHF